MKAYINRTATFAWSPATYESDAPLIATGTVAGALDESFSNESLLELWQPDYAASSHDSASTASADAKPIASISTSARFNRLAWGYANSTRPKGLLAAGLENGELGIWDAQKVIAGASEADAQLIKNTTHTGPVRGLDFNPLQPNLLSSGAVAGEIFIWDLNSPAKPYSPALAPRNSTKSPRSPGTARCPTFSQPPPAPDTPSYGTSRESAKSSLSSTAAAQAPQAAHSAPASTPAAPWLPVAVAA